jgi:hypothetical protein
MVVSRYDLKANRLTLNVERAIKKLYAESYQVVADYAAEYAKNYGGEYSFRIDDFPELKERIDQVLRKIQEQSMQLIVDGVHSQWDTSKEKHKELIRGLFGKTLRKLPKKYYDTLFTNHDDALKGFLARKYDNMNLSQRVWKITNGYKREMEVAMEVGIKSGSSAAEMSRNIRKFLNDPDAIYRRVRNSDGKLKLSTRAKNFHPGQGVYRSAYKNAMRVARHTVNTAYKTADQARWENSTFVVGVRIHTSNNSNKVCPRCRDLAGDYPKEFKWSNWHLQCMCFRTSILKTKEEMREETRAILAGEKPSTESVNTVKSLPKQYNDWYNTNKEKIKKAKNLPEFIRDNSDWHK